MTVGALALTTIGLDTSVVVVAALGTVVGIGIGFAMQTSILAVQNAVDITDLGMATSTALLARTLGGTIGTPLFGAVLAAGVPAHHASAADFADALPCVFADAVPVGLLAVLFGVPAPAAPPPRRRRRHRGHHRHRHRPALRCGFGALPRHSDGRRGAESAGSRSGGGGAVAAGAAGEAGGAVDRAGGAQGVDAELGLAPERVGKVEVPLRVDRRPVVAQADLGERGELVAQRDRRVPGAARGHDPRHQPETQRLVGVHRASGEDRGRAPVLDR